MPADLDQFGREYSSRAFIGGKGLIKLGHVAPNGRRSFNKINLKTGSGKIKRCLNTADPSTDNHDVSKITVRKSFTKLFNLFFFQKFFFHFVSPQQIVFCARIVRVGWVSKT